MLSTALKFRRVFDLLYEEDATYRYYFEQSDGERSSKRDGPPDDDVWDDISMFMEFLHKFYEMTLKFSVSTGVTSAGYFHEMWLLQLELTDQCKSTTSPILQKMAIEMKKKFDKYWGSLDTLNPLLVIAKVLDPRYKLEFVGFCYGELFEESKVSDMVTKVKGVFERLYDWYLAAYPSSDDSDSNVNTSDSINSTGQKIRGLAAWDLKIKKRKIEKSNVWTRSEIERYLDEDVEERVPQFDLLAWWKLNGHRYRVLSLMARDIFAMPVSTIASEAAFSTSGRVLDPYRSSLSPRTVEALICTQNWLRSNKVLITNSSTASSSSAMSEVTAEEMSLYDMLESEVYGRVPVSVHSLSESSIIS